MKTRAFDPETKQWRTDYVVSPSGDVWVTDEGIFYEILPQYITDWKLSRFTGHLDETGQEIYENHIVKLASGSIGVVVFEEGAYKVDIKIHSDEFEFYDWPCEYFLKFDDEAGLIPGALIIGDIFTTPGLLEVK